MSTQASSEFSSLSAQATLREACAEIGLDAAGADLIRFGQNAIYRLRGQPYVVRIARIADPAAVRTEVRVAEWLAKANFPATRLATLDHVVQPIEIGGRLVTVWELVRQAQDRPTITELGRILRGLHGLTPPGDLDLSPFTPFPNVPGRLAAAPRSVPDTDIEFLSKRADELRKAYDGLTFELPVGPIHGDAHPGNLMRTEAGDVVIGDLECFANGPREWDLAVPAAYHHGFGWISDPEYQAFVDAYGYDLAHAPCFPVLRSIRELNMTAWLMQNVDESEAVRDEFRQRMADLRNPDAPRKWRRF